MTSKLMNMETLMDLYTNQHLTLQEIGERYGVSRQCIQQRLSRAGVRRISRKSELDQERLRSLFVESRLSVRQIATALNISRDKVEEEIIRYRIRRPPMIDYLASLHSRTEIEHLYISEGLTQIEVAAKLGISLKGFQRLLVRCGITHRHYGIPPMVDIDQEDLRRLYLDERRTMTAIAAIYGCSPGTVKRRLIEQGITTKRGRRDHR